MAILNPRSLLIFIVPAFVVVVSYYWLKKKVDEKRQAKSRKGKCDSGSGLVGNSVHVVASSKQTDSAAAAECVVVASSTKEPLSSTVCGGDIVAAAAGKETNEREPVLVQPSRQTECGANVEREAAGNNHALNNKTDSLVEDDVVDGGDLLVVQRSEIGVSPQLPFSGLSSSSGGRRRSSKSDDTEDEADSLSSPTMHDKSKTAPEIQPVPSPVANEPAAASEGDSGKDLDVVEARDRTESNLFDVVMAELGDEKAKGDSWKDPENIHEFDCSQSVETTDTGESKWFEISSKVDGDDSVCLDTTADISSLVDVSESLEQMTLNRSDNELNSQEISKDTDSVELTKNEFDSAVEQNGNNDLMWPTQNSTNNNVTLQNHSESTDITRYNVATDSDINTSAYGTANHSPSEDMLESPAASNFSDIHSEGSTDSGKSAGDILMPGLEMGPAAATQDMKTYEFELPQELCGRLIGRKGQTIMFIKKSSHANIYIKRHPFNAQLKLCVVSGSPSNIEKALSLIRKKFPVSKFSGITLSSVTGQGVPIPDTLQLHLPEGIMCDVILSSLINGGHFFLQQPTHPTYPSLCRLDQNMLSCYMQLATPELPRPVDVGVICAAPMMEGWYRGLVAAVYEESDECDIKFVDYGGYSRLPISSLRQIRSDFMTLPFQASECYLANVVPIDEEAGWSMEAYVVFEEIAQGQILQAQVVAYAEDCVPYVHLYRIQGATTTFINRELVSRGVALWIEHEA